MKTLRHLSLLLLFCCAFSSSRAQYVTIPDQLFAYWLDYEYPGCMVGNQMDTTCPGIINDTSVIYKNQSISDFTGIQYFDKLLTLECSQNNLIILPELPATLKRLNVAANRIDSFPSTLPPGLEILEITYNRIAKLPPLPYSLTFLGAEGLLLDSLPALPANLETLYCGSNSITSLPALPAALKWLNCQSNQLTTLPALPTGLTDLSCGGNFLTSIPPLPASLTYLDCSFNQLTSLPALPFNLSQVYCGHNLLTSLPELPYFLWALHCESNPYMHCLPPFNLYLKYLEFDSLNISCVPNYVNITSSTPNLRNVPLCDPYSTNGCKVYWNIKGYAFNDVNGNCVQQSGDNNLGSLKVNLYKNGTMLQQTYTNPFGFYSFDTDTGDFTTTIDTANMPYDIKCPVGRFMSASVTPLDSLKAGLNFAMQCKPGFDIGLQSLLQDMPARPGATGVVSVTAGDIGLKYGSTCNTANVSGQVVVTISGPVTYTGRAPGSLTPVVNGNTLTYTVANWANVAANAFNFNARINTSAQSGQQICYTASVTPTVGDNNTGNNQFTQCYTVVNSYDPNDKKVSPYGNINNTAQWLTYTIRFQNTGTAPAIHIYVIDTLDATLDINSFELLAFSHQPVVNIYNDERYARFTFPNINLADSLHNEPESHGYIQYRIKTLSGLNCGTQIGNAAHIYFDYNPPVATNAAISKIYMSSTTAEQNTICSGEAFNWRNRTLTATGNYTDTLQGAFACDSFVTLNLSVLQPIVENQSATVCNGETYNWHNRTLTETGNYADTLQASSSCDSVVNLQLSILPAYTQNETATVCNGEIYNWHNRSLTAAGSYTDTLQASSSCDSVVNLQLSILPVYTQNEVASVCNGETYNWHNRNLTAGGNYTDTLQATSSCDSIVNLLLNVLPAYTQNETATVCNGEAYNWHNRNLTASGTYIDTLQAVSTCDSITTLQLQVLAAIEQNESTTVCNGETYNWHNRTLTATGVYTDTLQASSSCDSIINLQLQVLPAIEQAESATACNGEAYSWHNQNFTAQGTYTDTLQTTTGCDSVVILNLEFYNGNTTTLNVSIAFGDSYTRPSGAVATAPGIYSDTLATMYGCDSIIITNLSVISGIENLANTATMQLYPNPANDVVLINLSDNLTGGTLTLSDVTGRALTTLPLTATRNQLNIAELSSGVYLVTAVKGGVRVVQRLVVSR